MAIQKSERVSYWDMQTVCLRVLVRICFRRDRTGGMPGGLSLACMCGTQGSVLPGQVPSPARGSKASQTIAQASGIRRFLQSCGGCSKNELELATISMLTTTGQNPNPRGGGVAAPERSMSTAQVQSAAESLRSRTRAADCQRPGVAWHGCVLGESGNPLRIPSGVAAESHEPFACLPAVASTGWTVQRLAWASANLPCPAFDEVWDLSVSTSASCRKVGCLTSAHTYHSRKRGVKRRLSGSVAERRLFEKAIGEHAILCQVDH